MSKNAKIPFQLVSCSSYDIDYPPQDLQISNHGPLATGWQSERFCTYPQSLVFQLATHTITKIQFLIHHYKIPSRIDISYKDAQDVPHSLGYLSLKDNTKMNYSARELKSVHITADMSEVTLTIHKCHINHLNLYNQVGIVAFNLIGYAPIPSTNRKDRIFSNPVLRGMMERSVSNENDIAMNGLDFALGQDRFMIHAIAGIVREKKKAVLSFVFLNIDDEFELAQTMKEAQVWFTQVTLISNIGWYKTG